MSMPISVLNNFITDVPRCAQATRLAEVLDIFSRGQCDRLVVVSEQKSPIGLVRLQRLMPLMSFQRGMATANQTELEQQTVSALASSLIEPILTIPAHAGIEQFRLHLRSGSGQTSTNFDWALVDADGKFLGLLDSPRLMQFLAVSPPPALNSSQSVRGENWHQLDPIVQLLEHLPWPLMLHTSVGVIAQNPAWRQQLASLVESEAIEREVEALLATTNLTQTESLEVGLTKMLGASLSGTDPARRPAVTSSWCQLGTQAGTCICVYPGRDGRERVWQFIKIPLQESGVRTELKDALPFSTDLWLLLAQDVTEQQQLASELAAKSADLIHLNRLKDEFLSCISHELKTPLTAVLGLSTLLKDQALGQMNERQVRYACLIHQSGRHLMTVVNDILDVTRMETGQLELTLEPVQISTVCDRAIQQARAMHSETKQSQAAGNPLAENPSDHRFTLSIEPGLDSLVADELRLCQMLVHLLSNAFKFTEAGGEIELCASRWEGWIAFTVWDTGIGIPEQQQHLIFQKFQQLEDPLTRRFEGTGLGLVLTRTLARLHGGDVSFLSKEGRGSRFTLLLPPSPPQRGVSNREWGMGNIDNLHPTPYYASRLNGAPPRTEKAASRLPTPQVQPNRLVLVVEAAPRYIEDLTEQLDSLGYRYVIARSGTEAMEKARRLQPGAVLLNPLLPLLSGWDVLTLLKSDAATRQIPAVVTATRAEKERALANRADGFLTLPVQSQELQQLLARFCATSMASQTERDVQSTPTAIQLTILRLSGDRALPLTPHSSLYNYRILETDDLEQAEILARVWQPNVALLDRELPEPQAYLKQLSQYSRLKNLPLVTLDAATTQAANQVTGLSVFPYLTPVRELTIDSLLPVLQIAAGMSWQPSLLLVDIATLPDLQPSLPTTHAISKGSEWFQALVQYLQTAGFRGVMSRSWADVLQQIRQQSVDLLLICLGDAKLHPGVIAAVTTLSQQHGVPPVLILDRTSQGEKEVHPNLEERVMVAPGSRTRPETAVPSNLPQPESGPQPLRKLEGSARPLTPSLRPASLETVFRGTTVRIIPPSLSREELLTEINSTLAVSRNSKCTGGNS